MQVVLWPLHVSWHLCVCVCAHTAQQLKKHLFSQINTNVIAVAYKILLLLQTALFCFTTVSYIVYIQNRHADTSSFSLSMNLQEASVFSSGQFHHIVCWSECLPCLCLEFNKLLGCIDSKVLANLRWFWALLLQRSLLHLSLPALLGLQFCKCLCLMMHHRFLMG